MAHRFPFRSRSRNGPGGYCHFTSRPVRRWRGTSNSQYGKPSPIEGEGGAGLPLLQISVIPIMGIAEGGDHTGHAGDVCPAIRPSTDRHPSQGSATTARRIKSLPCSWSGIRAQTNVGYNFWRFIDLSSMTSPQGDEEGVRVLLSWNNQNCHMCTFGVDSCLQGGLKEKTRLNSLCFPWPCVPYPPTGGRIGAAAFQGKFRQDSNEKSMQAGQGLLPAGGCF